MEDAGNVRGYLSFKAAGKFCLLYFIFLLFLTLIFSAISCEPMTTQQKVWWWAFIASLIFTISVFMVALTILLYTDNYIPGGEFGAEKLADQYEMSRSMVGNDPSRTQSYKTILTINSMQNNEYPAQTVDQAHKNPTDTFMNLTPQVAGVTVVDMPAINAKRKENLSRIQLESDVVDATSPVVTSGEKDKKKKKIKAKKK